MTIHLSHANRIAYNWIKMLMNKARLQEIKARTDVRASNGLMKNSKIFYKMMARRKINVGISVIILLSLFINSCTVNSKKPQSNKDEKFVDSMLSLYKAGRHDMVLKLGVPFSKDHLLSDKIRVILGSAFIKMDRDSEAALVTNEALRINPNNHLALLNMAILCDHDKKYKIASKYYLKSLEVYPHLPQTYSNYAINRLFDSDYSSAIKYGEKAVAMANLNSDKGILCLSYNKAGLYKKRDSLLAELKQGNYDQLNNLEELIRISSSK